MGFELLMLLDSLENSSPMSRHSQNCFHAMTVLEARVLGFVPFFFFFQGKHDIW